MMWKQARPNLGFLVPDYILLFPCSFTRKKKPLVETPSSSNENLPRTIFMNISQKLLLVRKVSLHKEV